MPRFPANFVSCAPLSFRPTVRAPPMFAHPCCVWTSPMLPTHALPSSPTRVSTYLLLPAVHGLLVLLLVLVEEDVDDVKVVNLAVALKVLANLEADSRGGDVEGVERADFGGGPVRARRAGIVGVMAMVCGVGEVEGSAGVEPCRCAAERSWAGDGACLGDSDRWPVSVGELVVRGSVADAPVALVCGLIGPRGITVL